MMEELTIEEVLQKALDKEQEAHDFYARASDAAENPGGRVLLRELAEEELKHCELIRKVKAGRNWPELRVKQELHITEFLIDKPITPESTLQEILIYAMKREDKAASFYGGRLSRALDGALRSLFERLRQEELNHKTRLEELYDEVILSEN
ncbi:MAG: ferritin family protein [Nitrospinota bacterium]